MPFNSFNSIAKLPKKQGVQPIRWIALGKGGNAMAKSNNGITWTGTSTDLFYLGRSVTYDNGMWVAVGQCYIGSSTQNTIASSPDGNTWTGYGSYVFTITGYGVVYGNGMWVAAGQGGNTIALSPNGTTWTGRGTTILNRRRIKTAQSAVFSSRFVTDNYLIRHAKRAVLNVHRFKQRCIKYMFS